MKRFLVLSVIFLLCGSPSFSEQKPAYLDTTLAASARAKDLISRMTLEEKISQIVVPSAAIARLGIAEYDWRGECLHGLYNGERVTCFPQAIGMGATFDSDLIHQVASAISDEALAQHYYLAKQGKSTFRDNFTYWSPNINLFRDPRWGRGQETYGEDPYLTSIMGVAFVKGLQGDDPKYIKVASAPKHYAVHSGPDEIRMHFRAEVDAHDFWDTYMPQFEAVVKEGKAAGIMAAYSGINGVPCHANPTLLETILRKTWGFDGFVVSDGGAVNLLMTGQKYTKDAADTAKTALESGVDLENQVRDYPQLLKLVQDKVVPESRVDEALSRLLTLRFRVGMFDPPEMVPYTKLPYSLVGSPEHHELALKTARESIVLLKNNAGILPLERGKYKRIAVIGPFADSARILYGNYFAANPTQPVSILEAIRDAAGQGAEIIHAAGSGLQDDTVGATPVSAVELIPAKGKPGQQGLLGEYFDNTDLKGKPVLRRVDKQIDFNWKMNAPAADLPADHFSIRWTGTLVPAESGQLVLSGDDGIRMYVDGKLVVDLWQRGAANRSLYLVDLEAGKRYDLRIEYFEYELNANVSLCWKARADNALPYAEAVKAAEQSDLAIVTVGMASNMATEGRDWPSYALPKAQQGLLEAVKSTGKPMVIVLLGGNAIDLTWEHQNADAVVQAWFPGEDGAHAVADVLFGAYNPSGRLPVTYYKSIKQLPEATDYSMKDRTYRYFQGEVLYPFGYGLSYTSFTYSGLSITPGQASTDGEVEVTASVKNTGSRAGEEVAQLYISKDERPDYAPSRQLRGIKRVFLQPGETQTVRFTMKPNSFALVNDRGDLKVDPGSYTIWVGGKQPEAKSIAQATTTGQVSGKVALSGNPNYLAKDRPFPH